MLDTVSQELRSITKSKDANDLVNVSKKSFSTQPPSALSTGSRNFLPISTRIALNSLQISKSLVE